MDARPGKIKQHFFYFSLIDGLLNVLFDYIFV